MKSLKMRNASGFARVTVLAFALFLFLGSCSSGSAGSADSPGNGDTDDDQNTKTGYPVDVTLESGVPASAAGKYIIVNAYPENTTDYAVTNAIAKAVPQSIGGGATSVHLLDLDGTYRLNFPKGSYDFILFIDMNGNGSTSRLPDTGDYYQIKKAVPIESVSEVSFKFSDLVMK